MSRNDVVLTAQTPDGFMVAHAGREKIGNNRAPYFTCGVDVYRSQRAWENGAEASTYYGAGGDSEGAISRYFPQLAPIAAMSGAWTDNGEPMHGEANGWYWLSGEAAAWTTEHRELTYGASDYDYGRSPDHREDPVGFLRYHVEVAARSLRVSVAELPNIQDPDLFAEWIDSYARPRWQAEADDANLLLARLAVRTPAVDEPSERSEKSCSISLGEGDERISVRAWRPSNMPREVYRDGAGWHYQYRVMVRACGTTYTGTYGGSVADHDAGREDARGACNCVLGELRDALNYSSGKEWADEMGMDPDETGYRRTLGALNRCVSAAKRMRAALEANADEIGG